MKKLLVITLIIFLILAVIVTVSLTENRKSLSEIQKQNEEYEKYLGKQVFGTEVVSVINKASNSNIKNEVAKDDKELFIENTTNSIKVEIKMLSEGKLISYPMETIQKVGVAGFVKNFNLITFQCSNIEYHETTKKVSKIVFEQKEE